MREPQTNCKRSSVGNQRIADSPSLFLLHSAEPLEKRFIGNRFNGKHHNLHANKRKGKAHGSGDIVDDIQSNVQGNLGYDIYDCQKCKGLLFPITEEQCDSQLQNDGKHNSCSQ